MIAFLTFLTYGVDAGYQGRGKEWAEKALGLSVEAVHRSGEHGWLVPDGENRVSSPPFSSS